MINPLRSEREAFQFLLYVMAVVAALFYTDVIGLKLHAREDGRHVFFRCGDGMVLVFNPEHTSTVETTVAGAPLPLHGTRGAGHLAFAVREEDIPAWRAHLQRAGVAIESEIHWPQGGISLYVRDPAGNSIELATSIIWGIAPPN